MVNRLREIVFRANMDLVNHGLVIHTWGNVSGRDPETGLIVIKPSGVDYSKMRVSDMVVLDSEGNIKDGNLRPSTDAPTHIEIYKAFSNVHGVVHTHSSYATAWAQAGKEIPAYGTTHADHFHGNIPCSRPLTETEVHGDYEINTGKVIIETLKGKDPLAFPAALVSGHGPFIWGKDASDAVYNAVALEEIAKMALFTVMLGKQTGVDQYLLDKHFLRKHGKNAYYGQK